MKNKTVHSEWKLLLATIALLGTVLQGGAENTVHVGIHRHLHQPNYWGEPTPGRPEQSQYGQDSQTLKDAGQAYYGDSIQHPEVQLVGGNNSVFENPDKQNAYQNNIKNSIGSMTSSDAGMTISYSGALQRNLWSFGRYSEAGYSPSWNAKNIEAYGWKTSGGVNSRAQVLGQTYHHSFTPLLPESALRKEIEMFRERVRKSWVLQSDMSDQPDGFWPIELAFSEHLIPILEEYGYDWVMIPNSHLARTCPNYMDAISQPSPGAELKADPPNRADQNGPTVPLEQWYGANRDTYGNVFPVPFAYQLHKAKFVNPETGTESKITIVPQCDYHGYQSGYGTVGWDHIDGTIAAYNDPDHPALVMLTNDGENYWGGGSSFWDEFAPQFMNEASSHGKKAITIPDFVDAHPADESDVVHVEDGSWLAADQGSPQFYRWLEPPRRVSGVDWSDPTSIYDLENGWHTDMRNWAVMLAGVNHCETAEQIFEDGGGEVASWRIEEPVQDDGTSNNPNDAEQAWHFLLWGFDSGFVYFDDELDDEVKHTVAANRAISIASSVIGDASADTTPPVIFKPQRFPWNPGGKGKGKYLDRKDGGESLTVGFTTPVWSSDFYIWTFAYDVSGVSTVTLKIRVDEDGSNPIADNANETYAGGSGVGGWVSIPMTLRAMPTDDPTGNSNLNYYVLPDEISDYCWAKVTGYRDVLLDYYIESTDSKGNLQKSDIQHVYVEDDGTSGGQYPSASFDPAAPTDCAPVTVTFNAETSMLANAATVYASYHFSTNSDDWATRAMTREDSNTFSITFTTNEIPDNAPQLEVAFNDGTNWENNGGANWITSIRDCDAPFFENGVSIMPGVPTAGESVTVSYDPAGRPLAGLSPLHIHHGYNGGNWTEVPGVPMTPPGSYWTFTYTIPEAASNIVMVFNDGTTWDNNEGQDWTYSVNPASNDPVPDGVVITNPAIGTVTVASVVTDYTLQGTAGTNLTGDLMWTNSGTGLFGSFTPTESWSQSAALEVGDNRISISGGIAPSGATKSTATVKIIREAPPIPVPDGVVITNPVLGTVTVAHAVTEYTLLGTSGTNLTGNLMWSNAASGASGSLSRDPHWVLPSTLSVGDNILSISAVIAGTGAGAITTAMDSASAYASWTNDSNEGSGFGPWVLNHTQDGSNSWAGTFIGDPTNAAITGFGPEAFGFYANPPESGANAEVTRAFSSALSIGDSLLFDLGLNWDSNNEGSNRGFHLLAGTTELVSLNMANSEVISINGDTLFANYGSQAMPLQFDYVADGSIRVRATGRDGVEIYDTTLPVSAGAPDGIKFYFNATDSASDERQMYFDNLLVTTPGSGGDEEYSTAVVHIIREADGDSPSIPPIMFDPGMGFSFSVPDGYELVRVEGADTLEGLVWNWETLVLDTDYTLESRELTILSTGSASKRMIRIWLTVTPP